MKVLQSYVRVLAIEDVANSRILLANDTTEHMCLQAELFDDVVFIHDQLIDVDTATTFNAFQFMDKENVIGVQLLDAVAQRLTDEQVDKVNFLLK